MQRTDNAAYKVLREYFAALCSSSFDPATVANELFSKKIINEALRDETTRGTKNDQRRALVDGVMRAGRPGTFQTFLQILHKDDSYLAEQIRDAYQRATGKTIPLEDGQAATPPVVPTPPPPNVKTTPTTSTLSTECTSTTTVTAQVVGSGNTSVTIQSKMAVVTKVDCDGHCLVSSDGGSSNPAYKMAGNPVHGIALIISNLKFDKGLKYRAGGEVDEVNLQELFGSKYLNYKVVFLKNLKGGQIDMAFKLVSGHVKYAEIPAEHKKALEALSPADSLIAAGHDSFVCCLMSHGTLGKVYGTDKETFDLQNIYHYLGECKHLTGKPKMVFIQACQGDDIAEHDGSVEDDGPGKGRIGTKTADFLLSFAAFYGQRSFRWTEGDGSWYMSALCNTFKENYKSKDVVSMITDVHKEVMDQKVNNAQGEVYLQCPRLEHTLRHNVHIAVEGGWLSWVQGNNS